MLSGLSDNTGVLCVDSVSVIVCCHREGFDVRPCLYLCHDLVPQPVTVPYQERCTV